MQFQLQSEFNSNNSIAMAAIALTTTATAAAPEPPQGVMVRSGSSGEYEEDIDHLYRLFVARKLVTFDIGRIVCTPGSSSGDNYMSLVKRVTIYDNAADSDKSEMGKQQKQKQIKLKLRLAYRFSSCCCYYCCCNGVVA